MYQTVLVSVTVVHHIMLWLDHYELLPLIHRPQLRSLFELLHLDYSPIKGPEGNIEYLLHMRKTETMENGHTMTDQIKEVVDASHADLAKNKE